MHIDKHLLIKNCNCLIACVPLAQHTSHVAAETDTGMHVCGHWRLVCSRRAQRRRQLQNACKAPPRTRFVIHPPLPATSSVSSPLVMPACRRSPSYHSDNYPHPRVDPAQPTIRGTVPKAYPFSSFARRSEISSTAYSSTEQQMPQVRAEGKTRHHSSKGTVSKCGHARAEFSSGRLFRLP